MAMQPEAEVNNEDWLTPEGAAKILKVSKWTINKLCKMHKLPAINLGSDRESMWRISFRGLQIQAEANLYGETSISKEHFEQLKNDLQKRIKLL